MEILRCQTVGSAPRQPRFYDEACDLGLDARLASPLQPLKQTHAPSSDQNIALSVVESDMSYLHKVIPLLKLLPPLTQQWADDTNRSALFLQLSIGPRKSLVIVVSRSRNGINLWS